MLDEERSLIKGLFITNSNTLISKSERWYFTDCGLQNKRGGSSFFKLNIKWESAQQILPSKFTH